MSKATISLEIEILNLDINSRVISNVHRLLNPEMRPSRSPASLSHIEDKLFRRVLRRLHGRHTTARGERVNRQRRQQNEIFSLIKIILSEERLIFDRKDNHTLALIVNQIINAIGDSVFNALVIKDENDILAALYAS